VSKCKAAIIFEWMTIALSQDLCGVSGVYITLVEDHGADIIKNASKFFFITNLFIKVLT